MNRLKASILFITLALYGCSANWHLKKAIAKDPSIVEGVTVVDTIPYVIDSLNIKDSLVIETDTNYIDSIIRSNVVDTSATKSIRNSIYASIVKSLEADTARVDTLNYRAIAYFRNGNIHVELTREEKTIDIPIEYTTNKIVLTDYIIPKWAWKILLFINAIALTLIIIRGVVYFAFKK